MDNQPLTDIATPPVSVVEQPVETKPEPQAASERVAQISKSKKELSQIQKDLEVLIDAMAHNPSILSRITTFWGNRPLWQKIVAGFVLIAPSLSLGIFAHLISLIVISVLTLGLYVGGSVILDDHHTHNQNATRNIKTGVLSLAEGLEVIMNALRTIGDSLAEQITLFEKENVQFEERLDTLKSRNVTLTAEVLRLQAVEEQFRQTVVDLEKTCLTLKNSVSTQQKCLDETQATLSKAKIDLERVHTQLTEKTQELNDVNKAYSAQVEQQQASNLVLQATIAKLTEVMTNDEAEQSTFHQKLDSVLSDKEGAFITISKRLAATERELSQVKTQLRAETDRCQELITRAARQVDRLEHISPATASKIGLYAPPKQNTELHDETQLTHSLQ
jgi:predicted  nucleic acid-binding Zn-ribbon protein